MKRSCIVVHFCKKVRWGFVCNRSLFCCVFRTLSMKHLKTKQSMDIVPQATWYFNVPLLAVEQEAQREAVVLAVSALTSSPARTYLLFHWKTSFFLCHITLFSCFTEQHVIQPTFAPCLLLNLHFVFCFCFFRKGNSSACCFMARRVHAFWTAFHSGSFPQQWQIKSLP